MRAALKALGLLLGVIVALLCVLSAGDRVAQYAEGTSAAPAAGFGAFAYRQLAARAMQARQWPLAVAAAGRVVSWAPIEQSSASLLGAAAAGAGDPAGADAAFRVAGQLGWRDPPTQLYWLDQAVAGGEFPIAVQRIEALLRTGAAGTQADRALAAIEANPAGRAALAERLASSPTWRDAYLASLDRLTAPIAANRVEVLLLAVRRGLPGGEPLATRLSAAWFRLRDPRAALAVWTRFMGPGQLAATGFWDGNVASATMPGTNPFRWQSTASGAYELEAVPARAPLRGQVLLIRTYSTATEVVARQHAVLKPGTYRLEWVAGGENGQPADNLEVRTWCDDGAPIEQSDIVADGPRRSRIVTVSAGTCPAPGFRIIDNPPAVGRRAASWIGGIRLSPAGPAGRSS